MCRRRFGGVLVLSALAEIGNAKINRRSLAWVTGDADFSANEVGTLFHAHQPDAEPVAASTWKPCAATVVGDRELYVVSEAREVDREAACVAMKRSVSKRFLRGAEHAEGDVGPDVVQVAFGGERHLNVVPPFDLDAVPCERPDQAHQAEARRVQVVRHAADVLNQFESLLLQVGECFLRLWMIDAP